MTCRYKGEYLSWVRAADEAVKLGDYETAPSEVGAPKLCLGIPSPRKILRPFSHVRERFPHGLMKVHLSSPAIEINFGKSLMIMYAG